MHCPNCGNAASTDQQFCRSCGLNLVEFSRLLGERLPSLKGQLQDKKREAERWALRLWTGAGAIIYIALYWAIISEIIIAKGNVLSGILFLLIITAISIGGLLILYSAALEKRSKYMPKEAPQASPVPDTDPELVSSPKLELGASVTEQTTDLLERDEKKEPERRTQGIS